MSNPSQVCMSELQPFMTPPFIINAFQKLGHHPISAVMTKKRKGDEKEVCIIQFANDDAAKQAVFKLNGKPIPSSVKGFNATKFKLSQCIGNRIAEHNVWVGDLTLDVDDYHFFKFFADRYKSLCNAKVIVDSRFVSKGYGFLKFSCEQEQKHCLKSMGGSLGLGCRPIRIGPVTKGHANSGHGSYFGDGIDVTDNESDNRFMTGDPWDKYTSWNQFNEPTEYSFVAVKMKMPSSRHDIDPRHDLQLVDYNISPNVEDLNDEILERDFYFWDALECTKWLPSMALSLTSASKN